MDGEDELFLKKFVFRPTVCGDEMAHVVCEFLVKRFDPIK